MSSEAVIDRKPRKAAEPQYIDQPAIAAMLSIDRRTLRRLIVGRKFPPADLVLSKTCLRWKVTTVQAWLDEHQEGAR